MEQLIKHCENFILGDRVLFEGDYGTVVEQYHQWVTIRFDGAGINTHWDCIYCDISRVISA